MVPAPRNRAATRLQSVLLGRRWSAFFASIWRAQGGGLRLRALRPWARQFRAVRRWGLPCSPRGGRPRAVCRSRAWRIPCITGRRVSARRRGLRHGGSPTARRRRLRCLTLAVLRFPRVRRQARGRGRRRSAGGVLRLRVRCRLVLTIWRNTGLGRSAFLRGALPLCATVKQRKWLSAPADLAA